MAEQKSPQFLDRLGPLQVLFRAETLGGTLLLIAAIIAMVWANSSWSHTYEWLLSRQILVDFAGYKIEGNLVFWINDLFMAFFFLLVAMEIKRELMVGELNSPRKASLPLFAAVGGMVVPALLYTAVAHGGEAKAGWGIPMATDIAFALGAMRLLGARIPTGLFAFLAALAIIDDLGAILVIAIFYSEQISWAALGLAAGLTGLLLAMNSLGVRRAGVYLLVGAPLWMAVEASGIHATVAGVLVGLIMPLRRRMSLAPILPVMRQFISTMEEREEEGEEAEAALAEVKQRVRDLDPPLTSMEYLLIPYVTYFIVPLFALVNAGVSLQGASPALLLEPASLGVILGLVLGKPIGVLLSSFIAVRSGLASFPEGVSRQHVLGAGLMAGIGFTMALFIGGLAFPGQEELFTEAKVGILVASIISGGAGLLVLSRAKPAPAAAPHSAGNS